MKNVEGLTDLRAAGARGTGFLKALIYHGPGSALLGGSQRQ
jgi:hypothetical protein